MPSRILLYPLTAALLAGCISDKLHQETLDLIDALEDDTGCADPDLYKDADGDGYGDPAAAASPCDDPAVADDPAWVSDSSDCDDADAAINPAAADDTCDEIDNDCDDAIDEDGGTNEFFRDNDGDGYGDGAASALFCEDSAPDGYVANGDDCDDSDLTVYPSAPEACDGQVNNCSSTIGLSPPSGAINLTPYALDAGGTDLGWVVTGVGDWNGDGINDIAASAPLEGSESAGIVNVWTGPVSPGDNITTSLSTSGGHAGYSLSGRDGLILVGSPMENESEGVALLFEGDATPEPDVTISGGGDELSLLGEVSILATGLTGVGSTDILVGQYLTGIGTGWYVHFLSGDKVIDGDDDFELYLGPIPTLPVLMAGDIDGDGSADLAVAVEGTVNVYLGPITESPSGSSIVFNGSNSGSEAGTSLVMLEQSGLFAIGAPGDKAVYLISSPNSADTPYDIDNDATTTLTGAAGTGSSLAVGDFNLDGQEDLLIGASESGNVYLLYGPIPAGEIDLIKSADAVFEGETSAGWSVAAAEGVSVEGCTDILIGAPDSELVYIVPGGETW